MDRGAWQATVHGITRVGHDLATNQTKQNKYLKSFEISMEFGTDKKYR